MGGYFVAVANRFVSFSLIIIVIIITDLYSAFRSEDTEALGAAQED